MSQRKEPVSGCVEESVYKCNAELGGKGLLACIYFAPLSPSAEERCRYRDNDNGIFLCSNVAANIATAAFAFVKKMNEMNRVMKKNQTTEEKAFKERRKGRF